jgi:hypothetical protein
MLRHCPGRSRPWRRSGRARWLLAALAVGCGSRTGLLVDLEETPDAAPHGPVDAALDRGPDVAPDAAPPPIDAFLPDATKAECLDAGATLVYLITQENELYSFYPPTAGFTLIGSLVCPTTTSGATPWSMAVDQTGTAYSVFSDGELFRISTATAACEATTYVPGQLGWLTFGMGYAADTSDAGETLYVTEASFTSDSKGLGTIDTTSYALSFVASFNPSLPRAELTGTGDGRLFVYYPNSTGSGSHVSQIDKASGHVLGDDQLVVGQPSDAFAFAFWGGSFWIFTSPGGVSQVTSFDPASKNETPVTTLPSTIVGAGVSTCAPSQ